MQQKEATTVDGMDLAALTQALICRPKHFGHVARYAESEDMQEFLGTGIERHHNSVNMTTFDQTDLKMMPLFWMTYI